MDDEDDSMKRLNWDKLDEGKKELMKRLWGKKMGDSDDK